ncbi:uncharacterized protein LOC117568290 isoform X5 [Drosophila albomicans]|uniref:Uncharacterized protein LOC117568290 isoform X5 n=1 Tax=Drosophila albomicans TaxID=7291 RepID=A0A9C6WEL9_DROAB|nr:uncharacterized protein LOC117568290 isoform X5 [Drosophila albomicans]
MNSLNDDCLMVIIKYLNLNDQLSIYEATKDHSKHLNSSVFFAWKHQLCFELNPENFLKFEEKPEMLDIFLSSTSATMQELKLECVTERFLKRWQNFTFSNMKTLEYSCDWDYDADKVIEIMIKLFPGLRCVKTHDGFHYDRLQKWSQLRKLELSDCCENLNEHEGPEMIIKGQLLEEVTLPCDFFRPEFFEALMELPKLRTLAYYVFDRDGILDVLLEKRGSDIHKITSNDSIGKYRMTTLCKLSHLHQLTLNGEHFTGDKLCKLITDLRHLQRLDIIDHLVMLNEAKLWQAVASCPSLKILNISGIQLHDEFFEFSRCLMEATLKNRSQPLALYWRNTDENEKLRHFKHPSLRISLKPLEPENIGWGMVRLHLKPLNPS